MPSTKPSAPLAVSLIGNLTTGVSRNTPSPTKLASIDMSSDTPEEIVAKLRQVDVLVSQGSPVTDAIRKIGVTEVTY